MQKRKVDVAVISDVHLGTYACKAAELLEYLQSIEPKMLIINGDFFDAWQFSKRYFPNKHLMVLQEIIRSISNQTHVIYITGNHDDVLRRYSNFNMGNFLLTDKVILEQDGKLCWIFHGDLFDNTGPFTARFWGKMGSNGYALLLLVNKLINRAGRLFGKEKLSLSKKVMQQFNKRFIKIDAFETKIAEIAISKNYATVICGHIHQPCKREYSNKEGSVTYLNSGDWVEHMTALEYYNNNWHIYTHPVALKKEKKTVVPQDKSHTVSSEKEIFLQV